MKKLMTFFARNWLAPVAVIVGIAAWEGIVRIFHVPLWVFPSASVTIKALFQNFEVLYPHLMITLKALGIGYGLAIFVGVSLAMLLVYFPALEKALTPYIVFAVTFPAIALVPILMLWFGFGITVKIIPVMIGSGAIMMMNTFTGLSDIDPLYKDLMKSLNATRIKELMDVRFPSALPSIFTGLIIAAILGIITTVAAEFVGGSTGLGNRLAYYATTLRTEIMFAIIALLGILAVTIYTIIRLLQIKTMKVFHR
jgi:NitT/TauT family transport system permease protein